MANLDTITKKVVTALKGIKQTGGYNFTLKNIIQYSTDLTAPGIKTYPAAAVAPSGNRRIVAQDATDIQYSQEFDVVLAVTGSNPETRRKDLDNLVDDVVTAIDAPAALGDDALAFIYEDDDRVLLAKHSICMMRYRLVYVEESIRGGAAAGTDVYGTNDVISDALDKIYTLVDALKTAAAGLDPTIDYLYKGHDRAVVKTAGVTVGVSNTGSDLIAGRGSAMMEHATDISIRVHVAFEGQNNDGLKSARILNSIQTYLLSNIWLGDSHRIAGVTELNPRVEFAESGTVGGELVVQVKTLAEYTQS
jgi:hypothetical protein